MERLILRFRKIWVSLKFYELVVNYVKFREGRLGSYMILLLVKEGER